MIAVYIIALVIMIFLSMFFSSSDMAYGSASLNRLEKKVEEDPKSKTKKRALKLAKNYDKTISTILLFNDTVNAALDSVSTLLGITFATTILGMAGNDPMIETVGFIFSMVILVIKIIFGEIIAKSVGKIKNYTFVNLYSLIIQICYYTTLPITFLVGGFGQIITWPIRKGIKDIEVKDDELHEMIDEAEEEGIVDEEKADLIRGTIDYASTEAYEIMTPRAKIFAVEKTDKLDDILKNPKTFTFSRIIVFDDSIDNIIGFVRSKNLIKMKLEDKSQDISSIIEQISFFPRTTEINDILKYFRNNKTHMSVILDEYGGTEGIITREDILEEIVGEIWDETDDPNEPVVERDDGSYIIDGGMNLEDFCDLFNIDFDEIETEYVTIGGFIIELLDDRFANVGEEVEYKNLLIKVIAVGKHHTVKKLLVTPIKEE
ncbi:MAG TPA: hypothetical protein DDW20_01750 [Firmicutes bacterium]|nr:hypothetical protein [Bacillota bacterium]